MVGDKFKTKGLNPRKYKVIKISISIDNNVLGTLKSLDTTTNETVVENIDFIINNYIPF